MAAAIAYSDNIYAVKTHLFLGEETLVNTAYTCGIEETLEENPSLALGTTELNMMDFATAYTTLASNGYKKDLYFIEKVEDLNGNILYEHKDKSKLVLNQNNLYILNELLTNTTNSSFSDYTTPTALSIASKLNHKYALKTGTTNTDYWTVGYNKNALMLIWMGYDDASEISSNVNAEAKNIWVNTMETIEANIEDDWYEQPKNVIATIRDPVTGEEVTNSSKSTLYYFVKGSENNSNEVTVAKSSD
jgi:membrane peptidoglycan carboxypeptidase